jgi:hypothetical protein
LGISTTAAWPPAVEAGTGGAGSVVGAAIVAAAVVSRCGPTATAVGRGGCPVVTASPAARDALDERRLVGMDVSDLSAFAVREQGQTVSPCKRKGKHENEHHPLRIGGALGRCYIPQGGEAPFLFLEGSGGAAGAPVVATVAPAGAPAALVGISATRVASSTDRPAAHAPAPASGTCSTAASAALGDGGGGFHLSGRPPPVALLLV